MTSPFVQTSPMIFKSWFRSLPFFEHYSRGSQFLLFFRTALFTHLSKMSRFLLAIILLLLASVDGFAVTRWNSFTTKAQLQVHHTAPQSLRPSSAMQSTINTRSPSSVARTRQQVNVRQAAVNPVRRIDLTEFIVTIAKAVVEDFADVIHSITSALLWIRHPITAFLGTLPPSLRFFAQPFLILYLVPLLLVRDLVRPNQRDISRVLLQ
ncbi:hypothetical protein MPSEU_000431900 [Mayamaea pseudoterrestris]|nr:hypothetical protein MPSEU_000431900 [Mayamaea pseudoterrestris]